MITFECPHCANVLKIDDEFAGHEGWCRVCKEMIIVPGADAKKFEDLSPTEKYFRLSKIFKYAAARSDRYKALLAKANEENEQLKLDLSQTDDLKARLGKLEKHRNAYDKVLEHMAGSFALNANIAEALRSQIDALDGKLAKLVGDIEQQSPNKDETNSDLGSVKACCADLEESLAQVTRNADKYDAFMRQTAGVIEELENKYNTAQNEQVGQRFIDHDDAIEGCTMAIEEMKTQMQAQLQAFASIDVNLSRIEQVVSDAENQSAKDGDALLGQVKTFEARLEDVEKREQPELPDVRALAAEVVESRVGETTADLYARLEVLAENVAALSVPAEPVKDEAAAERLDALEKGLLLLAEKVGAIPDRANAQEMDALKARIDDIEVSIQEQTNELTANMGWMVVEKSGEVEARFNESIKQLCDEYVALRDNLAALPVRDIQETAAAAESRLGAMESAFEAVRREIAESAETRSREMETLSHQMEVRSHETETLSREMEVRAHETETLSHVMDARAQRLEAQLTGLQNALWAAESHLTALPAPGRLEQAVAGVERVTEFESALKRLDEELAVLRSQPDDARWDQVGSRLDAIDAAIEARRKAPLEQDPEALAQIARLEKQIIEIEAALQCEQRDLFETVMAKAAGFESKLSEISAAEIPPEGIAELVERAVEARMKQQSAADSERHVKEVHGLMTKIGEVEDVMRVVAEAVAAKPELDSEQFAAVARRVGELEAAWAGAPTVDTSGLEEEALRLAERVAGAEAAIAQLAEQVAETPGAEAPRPVEPSETETVLIEQLSVLETRLAAIERELDERAPAVTADEIDRHVAEKTAQEVAQAVKALRTKEKAFAVPDWAREPTAQPTLLGQAMAPARAPEQALLLSAFLRFMGRPLE